MTTKILIKDELTQEYYCVEKTMLGGNGEMTCGPNDFPWWDKDINQAEDFGAELFAKNEMKFNDLTCDGTRRPIIITINSEE